MREILLIGEYKHCHSLPVLAEQVVEFISGNLQSLAVCRIDNVDYTASSFKVMKGQSSSPRTAPNVPTRELDVLVRDCLNVEADSGDSGNCSSLSSELEHVQDRGLACGIQTAHDNPVFRCPRK